MLYPVHSSTDFAQIWCTYYEKHAESNKHNTAGGPIPMPFFKTAAPATLKNCEMQYPGHLSADVNEI